MTKNTKILLTAINARFSHSSLGVRYLLANLKELRELAKLNEYAIATRASDIVESILLEKPSIVTFGLYIWNIELAKEVIKNLKRVRPEIVIIVGGPEISFEYDKSEVYNYVDHVICGEGEHSFYTLCRDLLEGKSREKLVQSELPDLSTIKLPYEEYSDEDIKNRNISVEASRGCPFGCEFCISSLDKRVRSFPLDKFLAALDNLWERGVRKFKFIDRTFNLKFDSCEKILNFFLNKNEEYFLHFEMVPDRLPEKLRGLILKFPAGFLQFEIGIQSFNHEVAARIGRDQDYQKIEDNLNWLMKETSVHVHADLIVGLPGEDINSFAKGFNKLYTLTDQEIQVGILKRLNGAPISRHTEKYEMIYSEESPYEILQNDLISFEEMQQMKRFARFYDIVINSGNFKETQKLLMAESPFENFLAFANWFYAESAQTHQIALDRMARMICKHLISKRGLNSEEVFTAIESDYMKVQGRTLPPFIINRDYESNKRTRKGGGTGRQARHKS